MSTSKDTNAPPPLLVRFYVLIAIGGLSALFLTIWQRGHVLWAVIPVLAGALGLALRWRASVGIVLVVLGSILFFEGYWRQRSALDDRFLPARPINRSRGPFEATDLLVAASFLTYAIAHTRLLALTVGIFPNDLRLLAAARARRLQRLRPTKGKPLSPLEKLPLPAPRRSARVPEGRELYQLLVGIPIWVGLAIPIWLWLRLRRPGLPFTPELWRAFVLLWGLGLVLIVARAVFAYLRQSTLTVEEAQLYLQDVVWQDTRTEERLLNRWLDWARGRNQTREKS